MVPGARGLSILAVVGTVLVSGCAAEYRNHGYVPERVNLARIDIGDSREEVATVIGQPSVTGLLEDNAWFYVRSRFRDYAWRAPVEIDREIVLITFAGDRVTNIEHFGLRDGRIVPISSRVTDPSTAGVPFLRQVFGNVGNLGAAALGQGQ
jgi:outer membrane protein assembly factor BamE (lipoprotein component of BamABCDE complex)